MDLNFDLPLSSHEEAIRGGITRPLPPFAGVPAQAMALVLAGVPLLASALRTATSCLALGALKASSAIFAFLLRVTIAATFRVLSKAVVVPATHLLAILDVALSPALLATETLWSGITALLFWASIIFLPFYIFFGTAALIGLPAGVGLCLLSHLFARILGMADKDPRGILVASGGPARASRPDIWDDDQLDDFDPDVLDRRWKAMVGRDGGGGDGNEPGSSREQQGAPRSKWKTKSKDRARVITTVTATPLSPSGGGSASSTSMGSRRSALGRLGSLIEAIPEESEEDEYYF